MPPKAHTVGRQHGTATVITPTADNKLKRPVVLATAGTCGALLRLPEWQNAEELEIGMETTLMFGSGFGSV